MNLRDVRRAATAVVVMLVVPSVALAQGASPGAAGPVCGRLEAQLAAIDRGAGGDPARAEQARRVEDTLNKQQGELDRIQSQWQRLGCQSSGFFSIFANQPPQCTGLNNQIQQMRATIDRTTADLQRTRHGGDDEMQRQSVINALAQNNCGPQYRAAAAPQQRGFFETIFGGNGGGGGQGGPSGTPAMGDIPQPGGGGYRTLCVRTCDGYYFPISYSTSSSRFADDEQACHAQCPAAETALYSVRNTGEDVAQATASNGKLYRELANAFRYRKELVQSCSCRQPGQSWADALGASKDLTIERGDIVVTAERAKALSQPRAETPSRTQTPRKGAATMPAFAPNDTPDAGAAAPDAADAGKRPVRTVGPTFIPAR